MSSQTIAEQAAAPVSADQRRRFAVLAIALALGLAADFLIAGWAPALGILLFLAAVSLGAFVACRPSERADRPWLLLAIFILLAALFPLLTQWSFLSLAMAIAGLCAFTLMMTGTLVSSPANAGRRVARLLLSGPFTLPPDVIRMVSAPDNGQAVDRLQWRGWVVPALFGVVFIYLFQSANPIIESWLGHLDLLAWLADIDLRRTAFVLFMMSLCWPFLQGRLPQRAPLHRRKAKRAETPGGGTKAPTFTAESLFSHAAIVRSLVLFNALFAVQTALDVAYLWGGHALPDGMTYAAYAHRGAYPLVATALIAAAFTLVALRRGCATEKSTHVHNLILLWVGQNVLLVLSAMLRLDLYVGEYSLTLLRVAAFVWMGLVALGLVLIMVRVLRGYDNGWLVRWNLMALAATLYACSLVNIPALIAHYNVEHSQEISGKGVPLDVFYLATLGPQVVPALDRFRQLQRRRSPHSPDKVEEWIVLLERGFRKRYDGWRSWSLQNARLKKYLNNEAVLKPRNGHTTQR